MSSRRPFFYKTISELEGIVAESQFDIKNLKLVMHELKYRETDRAAKLRNVVSTAIDVLATSRAPNDEKIDAEQSPALPVRQKDPEVITNGTTPNVPTPPIVLERMREMIEYVIAVEKDKLKIVTDTVEHKAFNRTYDQIFKLPGVHFNSTDGDETAWLKVERLVKSAPPLPEDDTVKLWAILFDEPTKMPRLRDNLSVAECEKAGIAVVDSDWVSAFEDRPDRQEIHAAFERYVAGPWTNWAAEELPKRETMSLYGSLFALRGELAAPDGTPQEFVCGIGYAALLRGSKKLRYPLLTVPLDIELDQKTHVISIIPREEVAPNVESDALDVVELKQVDAWRSDARRLLDEFDDASLSPFTPATYDTILRQAAALLDPQARYECGDAGETIAPPMPGPELIITNAFGFFQRERRATQLMADLNAFQKILENAEGQIEIPGAVAALFTDPSNTVSDEDFPTFRGINSIPGVTSSDGGGADLYFPKPFNGEQVQIAQRLAVRAGVVVQGPPGTGKTHTIANIISHYLAMGKRVLVTSQKSPALQVLQAQLPAAIRPLSVSLLDSDREGLRQFRGSVDLIAERLQSLRKADIEAEIGGLETRIDGLHRQLAKVDNEIEALGRGALEPVLIDGITTPPLDAAREVFSAGEDANWFSDEITPGPGYDPQFTNDDIISLRDARAELGDLLPYIGRKLLPADLLDDVEGILAAHLDLLAACDLDDRITSGEIWSLREDCPASLEAIPALHSRLATWALKRDEFNLSPTAWDDVLEEMLNAQFSPVLDAINALAPNARRLADDHAWFLTRPVNIPAEYLEDPRFVPCVEDLKEGGRGLGAISGIFARKTKHLLSLVRVKGRQPVDAEAWGIVSRYIASAELLAEFVSVWNHACGQTSLPQMSVSDPAAGRDALSIIERLAELTELTVEAAMLTQELRRLLSNWPGTIARGHDTSRVMECLNAHLSRSKLSKAEGVRRNLHARLGVFEGDLETEVRNVICHIGTNNLDRAELRIRITTLGRQITRLHDLKPHFETVQNVTAKIEACGGTGWAKSLKTHISTGEDPWCPGDWSKRWRLRRLSNWLDASQTLDSFRTLQQERQTAEADLSRAYTRIIEQRTWLALKKQASPAVMSALGAYAVAVSRIGRGTGKSANRHRKTARQASNAVKGALPCWIMPHHRVSESLPAELGVFDLVIVDEASQSTLAALPALFRAQQVLIVGDDKQVSPDNVGLSMDAANARAARHLAGQVPLFVAPMREEASLYDLASVVFGGDNLMLREHFRCAAPIIEYSKKQFYRNELRPLRLSNASERLDPTLVDVRVMDGYRKGKTNPPEADFIVSELQKMGDNPAFEGRSFGVTTLLGTEQAALIYRKIENELGIPFIEKYHVRVGDPSAFQGDERDVMFLSMVVTADNVTALSGLGFEQRFNVAASRARERMILVRSIDLENLSPRDELRRSLLEHFRSPFPVDASDQSEARDRCESDFERDMFDELVARGYSIDTQVKVGGHRIDMVVEGDDDRRLAIECDGDRYHGPEQWPADMARQRTLERAGWRIWRCFASRYVRERDTVFDELKELLDALEIYPRKATERSRTYTKFFEWQSSTDAALPDEDASQHSPSADTGSFRGEFSGTESSIAV